MFSLNESPKKKLDKERKEILINQQSKPQFHGSLILKTLHTRFIHQRAWKIPGKTLQQVPSWMHFPRFPEISQDFLGKLGFLLLNFHQFIETPAKAFSSDQFQMQSGRGCNHSWHFANISTSQMSKFSTIFATTIISA